MPKMSYEEAQKQVKKIKDFYTHLGIYIIVCTFLVFLNLFASPEYLWVLWVIFGWGIGVAIDGITTFNTGLTKD